MALKVCVLGDGAWGTAIAHLLATNGHAVTLWCRSQDVAQTITSRSYNTRYLHDIPLCETIAATTDLAQALNGAALIFEAIPVKFLRSIIRKCAPLITQEQMWVVLSKGIENDTLLLPTQIIHETIITERGFAPRTAVVAGPSYAQGVALNQPTGVMVASLRYEVAQLTQTALNSSVFFTDYSADEVGVQLCAAYKNVIALAVGMVSGAGYSENTQLLLFMQGLEEMKKLVTACGGNAETVYSRAGLGDAALTALGSQSKNREVGVLFGKGQKLEAILHQTGYTPEGLNTLTSLYQLMLKKNLQLPLCAQLHAIVFHNGNIKSLFSLFVK